MPPSLGVNTVIIKEATVLLILRGDFPVWALPGGAVEDNEPVSLAAMREAREETGLEVRLTRLAGVYFRPQKPAGNLQLVFSATVNGGKVKPDGIESLKVEWFALDHLPERTIGMHRWLIADALRDGPAIVRNLKVTPAYSRYTRQEIYSLRNQGTLDMQAMLLEMVAPVSESDFDNGLG